MVVPAGAQSGPLTATTAVGTSLVGTALFARAKVLAGDDAHTVSVRADGTWGLNTNGQLGNGTMTKSTTPVQVGTGTSWAIAAAGNYHTMAVRADGTLWTWGLNTAGQLGDSTTTKQLTPVMIYSPTAVTLVSFSPTSAAVGSTVVVTAVGQTFLIHFPTAQVQSGIHSHPRTGGFPLAKALVHPTLGRYITRPTPRYPPVT